MNLQPIDIKTCQQYLLEIAIAFRTLCEENRIPYYMLGGTMLGAIRHKGFIPWDDDMDFGIPRPFFQLFTDLAKQKLPEKYELIISGPDTAIQKKFLKIQLKGSLVIETALTDDIAQAQSGISIDIFPLDGVNKSATKEELRIKYIFTLQRMLEGRYCSLSIRKGAKRQIAQLLKKLPVNDAALIEHIDKQIRLTPYNQASYVANYYGHWKEREIMEKSVFGEPLSYDFENTRFTGAANADAYLTALYGDYMTIPPKEKQITHAEKIFISEHV